MSLKNTADITRINHRKELEQRDINLRTEEEAKRLILKEKNERSDKSKKISEDRWRRGVSEYEKETVLPKRRKSSNKLGILIQEDRYTMNKSEDRQEQSEPFATFDGNYSPPIIVYDQSIVSATSSHTSRITDMHSSLFGANMKGAMLNGFHYATYAPYLYGYGEGILGKGDGFIPFESIVFPDGLRRLLSYQLSWSNEGPITKFYDTYSQKDLSELSKQNPNGFCEIVKSRNNRIVLRIKGTVAGSNSASYSISSLFLDNARLDVSIHETENATWSIFEYGIGIYFPLRKLSSPSFIYIFWDSQSTEDVSINGATTRSKPNILGFNWTANPANSPRTEIPNAKCIKVTISAQTKQKLVDLYNENKLFQYRDVIAEFEQTKEATEYGAMGYLNISNKILAYVLGTEYYYPPLYPNYNESLSIEHTIEINELLEIVYSDKDYGD